MANKTDPTRLGFALLLKFFQYAARFPLSMREVPTTVVAYIARQAGVPEEEFSRYDWKWLTSRNGKTWYISAQGVLILSHPPNENPSATICRLLAIQYCLFTASDTPS